MSETQFTVDLPEGVAAALQRLARESGVSPAQLLASAAAEKINAMLDPQAYFAASGAGADLDWFDRFMGREGGAPPQAGDEVG